MLLDTETVMCKCSEAYVLLVRACVAVLAFPDAVGGKRHGTYFTSMFCEVLLFL